MQKNVFDLDDRSEWRKLFSLMQEPDENVETSEDARDPNKGAHDTITRMLDGFIHPNDRTSFATAANDSYFPDDVHVVCASTENELLCEPHDVPIADGTIGRMRPCVMNDECVGKSELIQNHESSGGKIMREMLFPNELQKFKNTGELPKEPKCCVLCMRQHIFTAYLWCMHEPNKEKMKKKDLVLNCYVNPINCEEGYDEKFAIPLSSCPQWSFMIGPVVTNRLSLMRWVKSGDVWYVDQSALLWKKEKDF